MDIKEFLGQYLKREKELGALRPCREKILARGTSINTVISDTPKATGISKKVEDAGIELADVDARIYQLELQQKQVWELINSIPDPEYRAVLIHREINGYTNETTADIMNYSLETIKGRYNEAIDAAKKVASERLP